jgi:hypothetical protein
LPTDEEKGVTPIHDYLRTVAARGHMDFLPQVIPAENQANVLLQKNFPDPSEIEPARLLPKPLPAQHWGINE